MLDLKKEIILMQPWKKRYLISKIILYIAFLIAVLVFAYKIIFPSISFDFNFKTSGALSNTIIAPRNSDQSKLNKGTINSEGKIIFDTTPMGNFSDITISFDLENGSLPLKNGTVSVKKSYQAFFYPIGQPMGFKNGSLLSTEDGFYLISDGLVRKFSSPQVLQTMGYSKNNFTQVSPEDLRYNKQGPDITDATTYPNGTIFKIDEEYYQLKNSTLSKFISNRAFLSQYTDNDALRKDASFLEEKKVTEEVLGFADGALVSFGGSAFILSNGKSYPFNGPETFQALGYTWNDVVSADSDEIGIYAKQKLFYQNQPHPDGTIFLDSEIGAYYIISNQQKLPLLGQNIVKTYLRNNPVLVTSQSLIISDSCTLKKNIFSLRSYSCKIPLEKFKNLAGNDYQFSASLGAPVKISQIHTVFYTSVKKENVFKTLANIKKLIEANYTTTQ